MCFVIVTVRLGYSRFHKAESGPDWGCLVSPVRLTHSDTTLGRVVRLVYIYILSVRLSHIYILSVRLTHIYIPSVRLTHIHILLV